MPNHVRNFLTVMGDQLKVLNFFQKAQGRYPMPGGRGYSQEDAKFEVLCFCSIVPLPDEFSKVDYNLGIEMEEKAWGMKWGASYNMRPIFDPQMVTYRFYTPWSGAYVWTGKARDKFPELTFFLSWGGEGPTRGIGWSERGKLLVHKDETEEIKPNWRIEDGEEDAYWEKYKHNEQYRLREHPFWVCSEYALRKKGMNFPQEHKDPLIDWLLDNDCPNHAAWLRGDIPLGEGCDDREDYP